MGVGRIGRQRAAPALRPQAHRREEYHRCLDAQPAAERGASGGILERERPFELHRVRHGKERLMRFPADSEEEGNDGPGARTIFRIAGMGKGHAALLALRLGEEHRHESGPGEPTATHRRWLRTPPRTGARRGTSDGAPSGTVPACTSRPPAFGSGRMLKLPGRLADRAQRPTATPSPAGLRRRSQRGWNRARAG